MSTPQILIVRSGERFEMLHEGAAYHGYRSEIFCGVLEVMHAIERADGYVRLPLGLYRAEMTHWVSRSNGKRAQSIVFCERLSGPGELTDAQARVLRMRSRHIHPANWPYQLEGCIAPGLKSYGRGVLRSKKALRRILDTLGGHEEGRSLNIEIASLA